MWTPTSRVMLPCRACLDSAILSGMRAYEEVAEFIATRIPREVVNFRPSPETLRHVAELLQREKMDGITPEERRELDYYEDLELLMNPQPVPSRIRVI